jgi:hypothetical protein
MATRWAVVNGNWSNTATWDGGTLPAAGDDVFADGKTVTIDQNVTVLSIRNTQRSGGTNGGTFTVTGDYTINANLTRGSLSMMTYSGTGTLNINGNFTTAADGLNQYVLTHSGTGIVNIVGNITVFGANNRNVILLSSSGTINFNGIINFSNFGDGIGIVISSNGTLNFNGSFQIPVNALSSSQILIQNSSTGTVNAFGIISSTSGTATACGIENSGYLYFEGLVLGYFTSSSRPAIRSSATAAINIINGSIQCSPYGDFPLEVRRLFYRSSSNTTIIFADDSTNGQLPPASPPPTFTLYSADVIIDAPNIGDVRENVVYADGILTGTLAVPDPSNVRKDIPTDNTVGTADLTAQDFFDAIATSSDPVAIRLRNVATVETTGDQISAFNV